MPKRILSVSYDESLLATRQMILERAGFEVVSALGFSEALERCKKSNFDLVLLGHTIPIKDKASLIPSLKQHCTRVLSIRRPGFPPAPGADFSVDSQEGPEALIAAVKSALAT
jgi:DNA-binding NtrC family response regulator